MHSPIYILIYKCNATFKNGSLSCILMKLTFVFDTKANVTVILDLIYMHPNIHILVYKRMYNEEWLTLVCFGETYISI